jgi:hypothetical protein
MLAAQANDGDIRVWSIEKSHDTYRKSAKVVRVLKRSEERLPGRKWMGWSKNGHIIEYSEGYVFFFFKHPIPINKAYKQLPTQKDTFMGCKNEVRDRGRYPNLG